MPRLDNPRSEILQAAQSMVQNRGFGGFSYRDIAAEIGIKSASIHYHFPTKDDLIIEISRNYREEFFQLLDCKTKKITDPADRIMELVGIFQHVLIEDKQMCLCGMLAADVELLSHEAQAEIRIFLEHAVSWLAKEWSAIGCENPKDMAMDTFVRLEGALLLSRIAGSIEPFEVVVKSIQANLAGN